MLVPYRQAATKPPESLPAEQPRPSPVRDRWLELRDDRRAHIASIILVIAAAFVLLTFALFYVFHHSHD